LELQGPSHATSHPIADLEAIALDAGDCEELAGFSVRAQPPGGREASDLDDELGRPGHHLAIVPEAVEFARDSDAKGYVAARRRRFML
jgi:hypothetical protein